MEGSARGNHSDHFQEADRGVRVDVTDSQAK